ncbi:MAG: hypothetical protein IPH06_07775 [Alphaproteobacteria bacterium]|jgi:hypothetical protein|nr:hypothetical protein [Alphaproteobacteria bacterium]QQS57904.1 MAG: hypothetical protein IPN28_03535 [Alphaproteobacteria bacterium]
MFSDFFAALRIAIPPPRKQEGDLVDILMNPKISQKNKAWTLYLAGVTDEQLDELFEEVLRRENPHLDFKNDFWKDDKIVNEILEELDKKVAARELAAREPS